MQTNLVGYLHPAEVQQLKTGIVNDGNGTLGILDQLVYQAPNGKLCKGQEYLNALAAAGVAGTAGFVGGTVLTVIFGTIATGAAFPLAVLGFLANGGDEKVTLVLVNTTDDPLELVPDYPTNKPEDAYVPWGSLLSEPIVKSGPKNDIVSPPNRPSGHSTTAWIDSPKGAGMPAGSGAVGVWTFQNNSTVGLSFAGAAGVVRLKNYNKNYELFIGGESGYRSIFTSDEQNRYGAHFRQNKNSGTTKDYYDRNLDSKDYKKGGSGDVLASDKTVHVYVGGNGAKPEGLVVTVII